MSSKSKGATGLAGRYATALFELADEEKALDLVADDLIHLGAMIRDSDDLARLIHSPVISRNDQKQAMAAVLEAADLGPLTRRFVGVVAENRRLFALLDMISAYQAILGARRGEVTAEVISARTLSDAQLDAIGASLRRAAGGKVAIDARVDENLLGGLVVRLGSRMVDNSLSTKLQHLRLAMKGTG